MNTLNELQLSIILALSDNPNGKTIQGLSEEYGAETVYNECQWLKNNDYITKHIVFNLTYSKQLYSTRIGSKMPILTEKALEVINSLHA